MKKTSLIACTCSVVCLLAGPAVADGPDLTPGKWEFETKSVMPMAAGPTTRSETRCITSEEAEADPLAAMVEEDRCKVLSQTRTDDSITFEIECDGDPKMKMKMRGKGTFTATGDSASGKMDMTVNMPAMPNMPPQMAGTMTMTQTWTGKRLGDCD
jgi:hypothetical protein